MAARLLLIEDDASIARFVELALDGLPDRRDPLGLVVGDVDAELVLQLHH